MKRSILLSGVLPLLWIIFMAAPSVAHAHGTTFRVIQAGTLAAVEFTYSDGEPMVFAEVLVYSPQNPKVEHQYGRADQHGRFAFYPDAPGSWLITADDGMGHLCKATVEIKGAPSDEKQGPVEPQPDTGPVVQGSKALKTVAGLSVILNIALLVRVVRRRGKPAGNRS